MPKTAQLLNTASDNLLKRMSSSTKPIDINTGPLSLRLEMNKGSDIGGKTITTKDADIVLPKNLGTQNDKEDIAVKVKTDSF